ncbi:MAG: hypothetical protein HRF43_01330 [Phycisphaerae bacterium]|jgi:hypothetical protein
MTLSRSQRIGRWLTVCLLLMTSGGSTFLFSGCDPQVSSAILSGFNDLSNVFVDAFFLALQLQQEQETGTGTGTGTGSGSGT